MINTINASTKNMESVKKVVSNLKTLESTLFSIDFDYKELYLKDSNNESQNSIGTKNIQTKYTFPNFSVLVVHDSEQINIPTIINDKVDNDIFEKERSRRPVIEYDITRVSTRNAKKGSTGPYKTGELRQIILSYGMGKSNGTKKDLVNTIRSFHTSRT